MVYLFVVLGIICWVMQIYNVISDAMGEEQYRIITTKFQFYFAILVPVLPVIVGLIYYGDFHTKFLNYYRKLK